MREAQVFYKDRVAGVLEETATGGTRFTYDPLWQVPIACCFPVSRREHEWTPGLHPFFEHLAPEGWLRQQQARSAHIAQEDDFGLLLQYGADCIGAVGLRPYALEAPTEPIREETANPGRTLSGIQKKLLVAQGAKGVFRPAGPEGAAPYIAKFNSELHPDLVRNEALSLRWAAAVLGRDEVNRFTTEEVAVVNEAALIVTRFDRTPAGEKLRLEDFAQILCKPRGRDYAGKYDGSYEQVAEVISAHSARPAIDLLRFYRRLIVFILIGNGDAHLKNFSLLETPAGLRLSPAYDIVNTALYERYDQGLALSLGGAKPHFEEIIRPLLEAFGLAIGLPAPAVQASFKALRRSVTAARGLLVPPEAEPPDGFIHRYAEIVNNACLRIFDL